MRSFPPPADTRFYAGVDLHARSLYLIVLDRDSQARFGRNLPAQPAPFLRAVEPFRDGLLVACEGVHPWYGLADTCRDHPIAFVPGHARAMKAVHGNETKCDRKDAGASARLLKGGNFPPAYAYPRERRGLRDLLRARLRLVRQRAGLYGHVPTAGRQANLPPVSSDVKYKAKRAAITADSAGPFVRRRVETDPALLGPLDTAIRRPEAESEGAAQEHCPTERAVLQTIPGVGPARSRAIPLEIDTIGRFDTRRQFCPYARPCGALQESAGQRTGAGNRKAGNAWLKGAFGEAAVRSAPKDERIGALLQRPASELGKPEALAALAPKLGRACYPMLPTEQAFAVQRFVRPRAGGAAGEPRPNGSRRGRPSR